MHCCRNCLLINVEGKFNPSNLFTKILGWAEFWPLIQPTLFRKGETIILEKPLPEVIKEREDKILKDKEKDPTSTLRGVPGGVNAAVESITNIKTTWAGTTDNVYSNI
jgi:hypothetical protein